MPKNPFDTQAINWGPLPPPPPFKQLAELIFNEIKENEKVIREALGPPPPPFKAAPPKTTPAQKQFNDSVSVSRKKLDTNYSPVKLKGFSENRPEILCVTDFEPAYRKSASMRQLSNNKSLLPVGEKLKVMLQLARLRNHNIKQLISTLREDKEAAKIIDQIENEYDVKINDAIDNIRALTNLTIRLERSRDALNIRKSQLKIAQKMGAKLSFTSKPMGYMDILEDFGFNRKNISEFSNTKILMQICNDYSIMLANYSPGLLGVKNKERFFDDDPFEIIGNLFSLSQEPQVLDSLRQQGASGENYFDIVSIFFENMRSESVFADTNNRIKFLANFVAKELVISAGLGNSNTSALLRRFNAASEGNVFDDILGIPGGSVIEAPQAGPNALLGFMNVAAANGTKVLPFESPLTEDDEDKFVTGTEFFIDSIVQGQAMLDPTPLAKFTGDLNSSTSDAKALIERRLLSLRGSSRAARPTGANIFDSVLDVFNEMYNPARSEPGSTSNKRFVLLSLLRLSANNSKLKQLLYQYTLMIGIDRGSKVTKKSSDSMRIYRQIVRSDIPFVEDFPAVSNNFAGAGEKNSYRLKDHEIPTEALDSLINKIIAEVKSLVGKKAGSTSFKIRNTTGTKSVKFNIVIDALREMKGERSIFQAINMEADDLIDRTSRGFSGPVNNSSGYHVDTTTFRTRFSFVSPAVLIGILFELFASVSLLTDTIIESTSPSTGKSSLNIKTANSDKTAFGNAVAGRRIGNIKNIKSSAASNIKTQGTKNVKRLTNKKAQQFDDITSSLIDEDNLLASITSFIFSYTDYIKTETAPLISMVRQTRSKKSGKSNSTLKRIQDLQKRTDSNDIFATLNPAQIALSIRQSVEIQRSMRWSSGRNVSAFSDPSFLAPAAEQMLFAMLREPRFKQGEASNLKIITVGLPTGFKSSLRDIEIEDESLPGPEREADVISINIYRRDLEFEDIIFKPMEFTFELSRFTQISPFTKIKRGKSLLSVSNSIAADEKIKTFNIQVDEDFKWTSAGTAGGLNGRSETILNVAQSPGYDWMPEADKKRMFQNHIINYFLNLYLKLLTDIDFSESTFLINNTVSQMKADDKDRDRFVKLMLKKVKQVAGRTITLDDLKQTDPRMKKLLDRLENNDATEGINGKIESAFADITSEANIEITENIVNFMNSFSPDSFLTGADVTAARLTSPKLFERIFHMAVDLDNFEIDVKQTMATRAGRKMWKSNEFKSMKRSRNGRWYMKPRSTKEGNHIMSEIFANIESKLIQESSSTVPATKDDEKVRLRLANVGKRRMPKTKFNKGSK